MLFVVVLCDVTRFTASIPLICGLSDLYFVLCMMC